MPQEFVDRYNHPARIQARERARTTDADLQAQNSITAFGAFYSRGGNWCLAASDFSISAAVVPPGDPNYGDGRTNITITENTTNAIFVPIIYLQYLVTYQINGQNYQYTGVAKFSGDGGSQIPITKCFNILTNVNGQVVQQNATSILGADVLGIMLSYH